MWSLTGCSAWDTLRGHDDSDNPKIDNNKLEKQISQQLTNKDRENINKMVEKDNRIPQNIVVTPVTIQS